VSINILLLILIVLFILLRSAAGESFIGRALAFVERRLLDRPENVLAFGLAGFGQDALCGGAGPRVDAGRAAGFRAAAIARHCARTSAAELAHRPWRGNHAASFDYPSNLPHSLAYFGRAKTVGQHSAPGMLPFIKTQSRLPLRSRTSRPRSSRSRGMPARRRGSPDRCQLRQMSPLE
jgi:hypothetical protein